MLGIASLSESDTVIILFSYLSTLSSFIYSLLHKRLQNIPLFVYYTNSV